MDTKLIKSGLSLVWAGLFNSSRFTKEEKVWLVSGRKIAAIRSIKDRLGYNLAHAIAHIRKYGIKEGLVDANWQKSMQKYEKDV
jgi:hypothetical protein